MKRCVIKIGGVLLEDGEQLERLCRKLTAIKTPFVLVHGGGVFAGQLAKQLGIPCRMVDGRRVTDDNMMRVTVMAYAGWVNKILVARLQSFGVNACGLSGCDMDMVRAERRVQEGLEWGHVGDVARVNTGMLEALLDQEDMGELGDFADIKGQEILKRGMEIAAAGMHNILMTGAAGSGKSMIAKCLPTILPRLTFEESIDITKIYSVAGLLKKGQAMITKRPFRAPHHTVSAIALTGGGAIPKPGEISITLEE